ncbi:MAE_28990/MAE_18760 family HEPN-like nuclease [Mesorhizobium sp. M0140]|uniref:MAE_28990/MAE_18760 family HEPN-like nuclease n=1 Tax=Mesorhizobium sp. M0140 TaxID=2956893 RepID=UPI00333E01C9
MPKLDDFFDEIDTARVRRAKELSEVKRSFGQLTSGDVYGVASKAVVVLAYANWEGFYNECVRAYLRFLVEKGGKVRDKDWMLLVSAFHADFESMRDRNHSFDSRQAFVKKLQARIDCGFDAVDGKLVEARSNLDFARLSENYGLLNFDLSTMQKVRNRLDKELVGWRHAVAHGDSPDLTTMDVEAHISFTSSLLILIADRFQFAMLARI